MGSLVHLKAAEVTFIVDYLTYRTAVRDAARSILRADNPHAEAVCIESIRYSFDHQVPIQEAAQRCADETRWVE